MAGNSPQRSTSRRTSRRRVLQGCVTAGGLAVAGCLGDDDGGQDGVSMEIASSYEPEHINVEAAEMFKERIEDETDGAFEVTITPGGAYGSEVEIAELVQGGSVEGNTGGLLPYLVYVEQQAPFIPPFVIEDYDQYLRIFESDLVQENTIPALIEEGNQRPIGIELYRGERHFTANQPVRTPADVQDLELRMPELDSWVQIWSEIGADPTPVALDELYSALQTGVVDASEGDTEQLSSFQLQEVQSHLSLTAHRVEAGNLFVNEDFFQGLDESYQDLVLELGDEVTREASDIALEREQTVLDELGEEMEVVDDVDREAFVEAAMPAIEALYDEYYEADLEELQAI